MIKEILLVGAIGLGNLAQAQPPQPQEISEINWMAEQVEFLEHYKTDGCCEFVDELKADYEKEYGKRTNAYFKHNAFTVELGKFYKGDF